MNNNPSNETLHAMILDMKEDSKTRHADYKEIQLKMDAKLDKILEQTLKTNGRVNKHDFFFKIMWWSLGFVASILVIGIPLLYKLYNYSLDQKFKDLEIRQKESYSPAQVVKLLEEKYDLRIYEQ